MRTPDVGKTSPALVRAGVLRGGDARTSLPTRCSSYIGVSYPQVGAHGGDSHLLREFGGGCDALSVLPTP